MFDQKSWITEHAKKHERLELFSHFPRSFVMFVVQGYTSSIKEINGVTRQVYNGFGIKRKTWIFAEKIRTFLNPL